MSNGSNFSPVAKVMTKLRWKINGVIMRRWWNIWGKSLQIEINFEMSSSTEVFKLCIFQSWKKRIGNSSLQFHVSMSWQTTEFRVEFAVVVLSILSFNTFSILHLSDLISPGEYMKDEWDYLQRQFQHKFQ